MAPIRPAFNQLLDDGVVTTVEEEARFLDTAHRHFPRHYQMLLCALRTGLRFGELAGLHDGGRVELPKNKRIRRVDMGRQLAEELQRLKAERAEEALAKGWGQVPKWVFCNEDGKPLWKSDFERRVFHKIFGKAGMRRIRFHDLRHTFASRLLQNGEWENWWS